MTLFFVPQLNSARATSSLAASALRSFTACGAYLGVTIAEVLAVYLAVAVYAERYSIGNVKSQGTIGCPFLYVVGVYAFARCTALLAGMIVSLVNRAPPVSELMSKACARARKRIAGFPGVGRWSCSTASRARARAIDLLSLVRDEMRVASRACFGIGRMAMLPALTGTISRGLGAIRPDTIWLVTDGADFGDHGWIIPQQQNKRKYGFDERLAGMGLEPRLVDD